MVGLSFWKLVVYLVIHLVIHSTSQKRTISSYKTLLNSAHTSFFTGKIGDRPSGIYPPADTAEFPTEDILLIAMERVTVLFDR